jgi:hypothetical protein
VPNTSRSHQSIIGKINSAKHKGVGDLQRSPQQEYLVVYNGKYFQRKIKCIFCFSSSRW